jgi:uncharacterized protein
MTARYAARHALIALIGLFLLDFGAAAAGPPSPPPSPAALLIAKQIVELNGVDGFFEPVLRDQVEKVRLSLIQSNFMWSKDINDSAHVVYLSYGPRINEFVDSIARIYASHFTEKELKELLTFYQSPLGQKLRAEEPKALEETAAFAKKWGDSISEDVQNKMRNEMKKRGHNL